ncbi:MAG: DUF421 domain-containing protein [Clostridia bacterium]|nr:DUF421 domain-containing protein [Clostridia bacterium]
MEMIKVILTSLLSVAALFIIAKIMGHKQLAQLDFFDYISGITIGSIGAELATELEQPLRPLIALIIYGVVSVGLNFLTNKLPKTRKYVNGAPSILMDNGKLYRENMKQAKLDLSEFMVLCREQGYFDLNDIQTAIFEHNGKLSILPVSPKRPATPEDLNLQTKPAHIQTEIIMDGRVMGENLKRMGVDERWLEKKLAEQGYKSAKEIFLGVCDSDKKLLLFAIEP